MNGELPFKELAAALLARAGEYVISWCPGGKIVGREYMCGSIHGGEGNSFRVNLDTGMWADFASTERGGDLISLYAALNGISNGKAFRELQGDAGVEPRRKTMPSAISKASTYDLVPPPPDHNFRFIHPVHGKPSRVWPYPDKLGNPIFYIARYDTADGKQVTPWSWDARRGAFVAKGWSVPRPLMGLDLLEKRWDAPVMVVEGEKCVDAARQVAGHVYVVVTWCNGSNGVSKADWKPLFGRKVLIWPDADRKVARTPREIAASGVQEGEVMPYGFQPGPSAAAAIAGILVPHCPEVKVIDVGMDADRPDGWDVADAVAAGWNWQKIAGWAKPRLKIIAMPTEPPAPEVEVVDASAPVTVEHHVMLQEDHPNVRPATFQTWEKLGVPLTKTGQPIISMDTALRVVERHPEIKDSVWFDDFHQTYFTTWKTGKQREWSEIDTLELTAYFQRDLRLVKMGDDNVFKAVLIHANNNTRNEPRDWIKTLRWDGIPRIGSFFPICFGAVDTDYTRAVSRNFWISMVARIMRPGCKVDTMVVLEGNQGTFKSTALDIIGRGWYTEAQESVSSKDFFMVMRGKMIVEIGELDSFRGAENTRIKQIVSCRTDRYRPPYGKVAKDWPRQCIFVGTTNEEQYLGDNTGGRRFWPIRCSKISKDRIGGERDQMFAEAFHEFNAGSTWWDMPGETSDQQEQRRHADEWETPVREYLERGIFPNLEIRMADIAQEALHISIDKLDKRTQWRIAGIMRALGYKRDSDKLNGINTRAWVKVVN